MTDVVEHSEDYKAGFVAGRTVGHKYGYDSGYDDGKEDGVEEGLEDNGGTYDQGYKDGETAILSDTVDGTSSRLIEVFVLDDRLYVERGGEFRGIDTRTGEIVETRFRVPNGARRINYAR